MLRPLLFCLALLCSGLNAPAGVASFTERGKIDFDRALQILNPYGTWSKIDGKWAYTPLDHQAPYTNGRWLYTEYGWCWKGNHPHSWITEHYGYWKRGADKSWAWYPGPYWLSEIVEFRATPTHIGWRSGAVDRNGEYVEAPDDRYAKGDEWTFVTKAQFAGPITPGIITKPEVSEKFLIDSTDCNHAYLTYRPLDRPGPHPADFLGLNDGGMFSPLQNEEVVPPPYIPGLPKVKPPTPATNAVTAAVAKMTGTNGPAFTGTGADSDPSIDKRQVKYWISMSLPTYWTTKPDDAKPEEVYFYRPDFFQDEDGISRRITVWFDPKSKTSLKEIFAEAASAKPSEGAAPTQPATPAPAASAKPRDPFQNPIDVPPRSTKSNKTDSSSTTNAAPSGLAPTK